MMWLLQDMAARQSHAVAAADLECWEAGLHQQWCLSHPWLHQLQGRKQG
jgi:hypothetical protein